MNIRWSLSYRSCHRVLIPLHQTTSSLEKPSLMYSAIRLLSRKNLNKHGAASNLEGRNRLQNSGTSRNIKERVMFDHVCTFHETYQTFRKKRRTTSENGHFRNGGKNPGLAPRENPVRLGHQLFQRQALAINTIAFAELVQGLEGMDVEDMMRIWWGYDKDMMRIGKQNHKQNSHKLIQVIDSDEKTYPLDSITLFSERFPWFPNPIYWGFQIICSIDLL